MAWWDDYFRDVDSFNIDRLAPWFDDNVKLRFANWPEQQGKVEVLAAFTDFWTNLKGLSHRAYDVMAQEGRACVEADVIFDRLDGRKVAARAATVFERPGNKITAISVYIDVAPVFAD